MTMEQEAYTITTHDVTNNKLTHRAVTPLAQPDQRFTKPETPSLDQLRDQIDELTDDITGATQDFDHAQNNLDEYYRPLTVAREKAAQLRAELAEAEAELAQLEAHGSPRDGFWSFINECEGRVSGIARQLLDRFCTDAAVATFKVPFSKLTEHTQKDLSLVYRQRLERFASNFYIQFRRREEATGEQIKTRASQLLRDLQTILTQNFSE